MQPNSPLFRSGIQPRHLWDEARVIEGQARQLQVFQWENRLVCHEHSSDLWWATLDERGETDACAFWNASLERARVARLQALRRGFDLANGSAQLSVDAQWFDVLIESDNGGWARAQGETQWLEFAPLAPRRVNKPLARVPSIWSPRFRVEFGRRSMGELAPRIASQMLADAPSGARELWQRGAGARAVRLAIAANAQGWVGLAPAYKPQYAPNFWEMAILKARRPVPPTRTNFLHSLNRNTFSLPAAMRKSPYLAPKLRMFFSQSGVTSRHKDWVSWREERFSIRVKFWSQFDSAHQSLEAKLELRDWLGQFFAADEVNRWLQ